MVENTALDFLKNDGTQLKQSKKKGLLQEAKEERTPEGASRYAVKQTPWLAQLIDPPAFQPFLCQGHLLFRKSTKKTVKLQAPEHAAIPERSTDESPKRCGQP